MGVQKGVWGSGGRSGVRRAAWFGLHGKEPPHRVRPRGAAGTGKDTDGVRTGCPRGAHGPAAAGGWMDGWMDGRATPLQPLLGELAA